MKSIRVLVLFALPLAVAYSAPQNGGDFSQNMRAEKVPAGVILVKGAWSSSSDSVTPLPERGTILDNVYSNDYFGITYPAPKDWTEKYTGPPPSDSGYYTLAQLQPGGVLKGAIRGNIQIAAQDLFFSLTPAANSLDLLNYMKDHLGDGYKVEQPVTEVRIANRSFLRFDYVSPIAGLHWHVLATQIRCHMVKFVFTSRDAKLIESLIQDMSTLTLAGPTSGEGGGDVPVCIKDYAIEGATERDDPVFGERTFNPVPVRIIVGKDGKVKSIHFLSAFPMQAKSITEALMKWRFKPYMLDGQPVEVETGIMFGNPRRPAALTATGAIQE